MNLTGILLVTLSCITHSLWNLQAKKKSDQPHFLFWMLVTVSLILAIPSLGIGLWRPLPLSFWLYGLVLYAMMTNEVLYVVGFRQLGILFGVILGIAVLKENQGVGGRVVGAIAITVGLIDSYCDCTVVIEL